MNMLLIAMICTALIVISALVMLVILLRKPAKKQTPVTSGANGSPRKSRKDWILFAAVALLLALWSIWIGLLFLSVVWLLRRSPGRDATYDLDENQKRTAKRVYAWLFWSSFITVPTFILAAANLSWQGASTNERVFVALVPLFFHAFLLLGLTSKSAFVFRHTQQGILLISIRAGLASLAISIEQYPEDGIWLFLLGNGALWLFGSLAGYSQIKHNDCWWMRRKGEAITVLKGQGPRLSPQLHLEKSREFIQQYKKPEAFQHALAAFRAGDHEIRLQAIQVLDTLDEVEQF